MDITQPTRAPTADRMRNGGHAHGFSTGSERLEGL